MAFMMTFFSSGVRSRSETDKPAPAGVAAAGVGAAVCDGAGAGVWSDVIVGDDAAQAASTRLAANAIAAQNRTEAKVFIPFPGRQISIIAGKLQMEPRRD